MYTSQNFQTKKQLREAIAKGREVFVFSPGPFGCPANGQVSVEGPHYVPHRWYARVEIRDGQIIKVLR